MGRGSDSPLPPLATLLVAIEKLVLPLSTVRCKLSINADTFIAFFCPERRILAALAFFNCKIYCNSFSYGLSASDPLQSVTFSFTSFIFAGPYLLYAIFGKCHGLRALGTPRLKVKTFF